MKTLSGLATARGLAIGPVFVYRDGGVVPIVEYSVNPGGEVDELARLNRAICEVRRDLDGLVSVLRDRTNRSDVRVFECHLMLLEDPVLIGEIEQRIREERVNVEAAVCRAMDCARRKFEQMSDPYLRERARDLDDVERRLLKVLAGLSGEPRLDLKVPSIVVADDLTPSEVVQLPREFVLGFATNGGSTTSHVALLARAMGIPAVTALGNVTEQVKAGETVLLDGTHGTVMLSPDGRTIRLFSDRVARQRKFTEETVFGCLAGTLKDGGDVPLCANLHPGAPVGEVKERGARGVGLYRSEYLWLGREREPTEDEQFEDYRSAAEFVKSLGPDAELTIRTLDIGGDKLMRGVSADEANPFLGNRSIRYLLSNPTVFRTQLRAILRASAYGPVRIMYPMVSCVEELTAAAAILADVRRELDVAGVRMAPEVPVGVMIEVPAAALNADALARHVSFFSIGTNDLVQYTMAADRGNESVAHLYQPVNPAVLKLMRMTIGAARRNGIGVGVCGESAADPVVGALWAAMGVDSLSMSATCIPILSKVLSRLTRTDLDEYCQAVEGLDVGLTGAEILTRCREWMTEKIPDLREVI